jgi:Flp pilus assembly protein TadD
MATGTEVAQRERTCADWRALIGAGRLDEAVGALTAYLASSPRDADALHDLGVALGRKKRFAEAAEHFQQAVDIEPGRHETWRNLARALEDAGRAADAEAALARVAELRPDDARAHRDLGRLRGRLGRHEAAVPPFQKAVELEPASAEAHLDLGKALADLKRLSEAKKACRRAVELDPLFHDAFNSLGVTCQQLGHLDEAVKHLREAVRLRPGVAGAYNNLGVALNEQRKHADAVDAYNKALAIAPDNALAWNNLGNALRAVGRNEAAVAALETAVRLKPDYPEAYNNLAIAFVQLGKNETALRLYDKALRFRPDYPECHMNRALQRLLVGDLANGWADYEWRWALRTMKPRSMGRPRWDGTPLGGKRVLIHWEQGLGDSIQFIRYAKELKNRGAGAVIFEGQAVLERVLSRTPGLDEFVPKGGKLPAYDVYAPLLSLPGQCHTTADNVPCEVPYVLPDPYFVNCWAPRLEALRGLRVGIAWQGNPDHRGDHIRSIPLRLFEPLARVVGVSLVSLQRNQGSEQIAQLGGLFDLTTFEGVDEDTDGFLRTAAIIKNLDLVITADTAVAHLSGAMGVPVWVCLAVACDWRWLRYREDTPWYPTARLFRQREPGDWPELFARVAAALRDRVAATPRRGARSTAEGRRKAADLVREANRLGSQGDREKLEQAREKLQQAVREDPESSDAHHDLGAVLGRQGFPDRAIDSFRRAIELKPSSGGAHGNIGLAFLKRGQAQEAASHLRSAVRLGAGSADVYNNLGLALMAMADARGAEESFVKALQLRPDFAIAHRNLARALLMQGKFEQGWLEYEWRWKCYPAGPRVMSQPRWTGLDPGASGGPAGLSKAQPLKGKTVLLHVEGPAGLGDTIQFVRYASLLKQAGARVVVECQSRLVPLISRCGFVDQAIGAGSKLPRFDMHASLVSMPTLAGTTLDSVPAPVPYLSADPTLVDRWAPRLKSVDGLRVGISWQGEPRHKGFADRRIPIEQFQRLGRQGRVKLFRLQTSQEGGKAADVGGWLTDLGPAFDAESGAFMDTAAVMAHLDLVITADTAVAHLAGALGAAVWLVLPHSPDFRWLLDRPDSPWYPTMRIFRQDRGGDWDGVFKRVAEALRERLLELAPSADLDPASMGGSLQEEGARLYSGGDLAGAADRFSKAVELRPGSAAAHHDLAVALSRQRRFDEAIGHFRRALELDPSMRGAISNLSLALVEGDYPAAADEAHKGLELTPDSLELRCRLGAALVRLKHFAEAENCMIQAAELHPQSHEAHYWLGEAVRGQQRFAEAAQSFREAARLRPEWPNAHNHLGLSLAAAGRHGAAADAFGEAVRLRPDSLEFHSNLGISVADESRLEEAAAAFQHALYLRPDSPESHRNLAIVLLLQGKYEQGWLEYEWRLRLAGAMPGNLPGRRWDGSPLKGKSVLMLAEQGLGDTLQFVRYAKLAKEQGASVVVECQRPLGSLLSRCPFIDEVVASGSRRPRVDLHAPLMSLPVGFRTTMENIPSGIPYLSPDQALVDEYRQLIPGGSALRVGIAWQGNPTYAGDQHRSIPLAEFAPLGHLEGVELISLQKGAGTEQLGAAPFPVHRLPRLEDAASTFEDTAAIVANLDAVVACDTGVAHLAGAMGVPVLLALSTACDWRWMRARTDSPWYPTVRLFRQHMAGIWPDVFRGIAAALGELRDSRGQPTLILGHDSAGE